MSDFRLGGGSDPAGQISGNVGFGGFGASVEGFSGIFDAILQDSAQRAYMETEGMYTQAEEAFETAQRDLRDIQFTVPQDQQADALADYLRKSGYSSHVVEQTLGIPREEVDAALMAAGYDYEGQPLPEGTLDNELIKTTEKELQEVYDSDISGKEKIDKVFDILNPDDTEAGRVAAQEEVLEEANRAGYTVESLADIYRTDDTPFPLDVLYQILMNLPNNQDAIDILGRSAGLPNGNGNGENGDGLGENGDGLGDKDGDGLGDDGLGDDVLDNGTGNDTIIGETGNDTVIGDTGNDVIDDTKKDTVITDTVIDDTPRTIFQIGPQGPQGEKGEPGKSGLIMMLAQQAPITEQMFSRELFEPQLRQLENVLPAATQTAQIAQMFAPRGMLRGLV